MKSIIIILIFLILFITNFNQVSATSYFTELDYRLKNIPTYCVFISSSEEFSEVQENLFFTFTEDAVNDWKSNLQRYENLDKSIWNMKVNRITGEDEKNSCSIVVKFEKNRDAKTDDFLILGFFNDTNSEIKILVNQYQNINIGSLNTITHEIGHSLGLGHYISDNPIEMKKWIHENISPPSIMTPIQPIQDPSVWKITENDIKKIRSIYGTYGFYAFSENIPNEILELSQNPLLPEPTVDKFEWFETSIDKVIIKNYLNSVVKLSGKIYKDELFRGLYVNLLVVSPNGEVTIHRTMPTKDGDFQVLLNFNSESHRGTYTIEPIYKEFTQNNMKKEIIVTDEVSLSKPQVKYESKIPIWIKNNAKWWSEGAISEHEFLQSIEFLIKVGTIDIPDLPKSSSYSSKTVPGWIKNNARWWSEGIISELEFIQGLQYLISNGIIKVDP